MYYSAMVPKNHLMESVAESNLLNILQFNADSRSQLGNASYKICMLTTPNELNY